MKKPPKKSKYHNRKITNKWTKIDSKNILNFPKHLPFSLLIGESSSSSNSNNMMHHHNKINDDEQQTSVISVATSSAAAAAATSPTLPPSLSSLYMPSDSTNVYIPENIYNGNTVDYATDDAKDNNDNGHASSIIINNDDKHQMITARPIVIYENRQTTDGAYNNNNQMKANEKGYFEKTIFNKNGIFIEKIRKIADIDDTNTNIINNNNIKENSEILSHHNNDNDNNNNDGNNDDDMENINRKRIALMNVPLSQHYVITSSGKIEKTDTLASNDVIEQFRDGLNDFRQLNQQTLIMPTTLPAAAVAATLSSAIDVDFVAAVDGVAVATVTPTKQSTTLVSSAILPSNVSNISNNRPTSMSLTHTNTTYDSSSTLSADIVTHYLATSTTINNQKNGTSNADANQQELNCLVMGK